jgi:CubicO group peptidase (beta-lactamase class C family)
MAPSPGICRSSGPASFLLTSGIELSVTMAMLFRCEGTEICLTSPEELMSVMRAEGLLLASLAAASGPRPAEFRLLARSRRGAFVPGVSIAVIEDYRIEWAARVGMAAIPRGAPVTPETLFQAASVSKPIHDPRGDDLA